MSTTHVQDCQCATAAARWLVLERHAKVLAGRGHVKLDFAEHLELLWRWPSRWWSRTRSRDRCRQRCRISAPERAIARVVIVEPAESASVAWRCVVAGFHCVIVAVHVVLMEFPKTLPIPVYWMSHGSIRS